MRKQIPFVQEPNIFGSFITLTYASDIPGLHKNGYIKKNEAALDTSEKYHFLPRPVIASTSLFGESPGGTNPNLVAVAYSPSGSGIAIKVYSDGTLAGTSVYRQTVLKSLPGTWSSATKSYHLTELASASSGLYGGYEWFMNTPTEGAVIAADGTITEITDADYVTGTGWTDKTNAVPLDGFIFQGSQYTCKIYNCDQNAPTSWAATSVLDANLIAGRLIRLERVRNYLLAFKTNSIEFFKNAGNPTPGSPLEAIPELVLRYGCQGALLVTRTRDGIIFVGTDESGNSGVFKLDTTSFTVKRISNSFIDAFIQFAYGGPNIAAGPYSPQNISSVYTTGNIEISVLPWRGFEFVMVPVYFSATSKVGTMVYDNSLGLWYLWTTTFGGTEIAFPWKAIRYGNSVQVYNPSIGAIPRLLNEQGFLDFETTGFVMKWCSNPTNFGTFRRKFQASLEVGYDLDLGVSNGGFFSMYYYDNDGTTPCNVRMVSTNTNGIARAIWRRLGSFRTRRYVITYTGATAEGIKWSVMECDINASEDSVD